MKKNLQIEAGQVNRQPEHNAEKIDAINQVFAVFKRNYHNQFFKAFANETDLKATKRLWLESLKRYSSETILKATQKVIETSEFLPTLHTMLAQCNDQNDLGLPDAHNAYIEACRAPSPKADYAWSHPIVYHAAKSSDWFFLQNNSENMAYPIYKKEYEKWVEKVRAGEILPEISSPKLEKHTTNSLSNKENKEKLSKLKSKLNY